MYELRRSSSHVKLNRLCAIIYKKELLPLTIKHRLLILNIIFVVLSFFATIIANNVMNFFIIGGPEGFNVTSTPDGSLIVGMDNQASSVDEVDILSQSTSGGLYQLDSGGYVFVIPEEFHNLFENLAETDDSIAFDFGRFPQSPEILQARFEFLERYTTWVIIGFLSILAFLVNLIFRKMLLTPIKNSLTDLETGVEEIGKDNLSYRIESKRGNEFDRVYRNFNEMANKLLEMTERKELDENSRKELIAGISHDLKTPLTSINAYAEGIKKGVATTPQMQEKYMNVIQSKAQEMTYIINQLFLFSKIDLGEFPFQIVIVDIGMELEKMVASFVVDYEEKDVLISLSKNVSGVFVAVDVVQFKNVVQNIVGNSIKYGSQTDGEIDIRCEKQNNNVSIIIRDNGSGVTDEALKHMFDVFYRGDDSRNSAVKGSGLGLAISSKIINRLNGTIEADNSPHGGLVTTIRLPIEKEDV